ncbi:UDP-N-acetylglucosamine 4-epimerase [Algimonas arctica]|uniref:UDP-N-acetylglucosamine 4-epimerase n=1 Tax=Algimonas arctica TaxID=1479486 RepID=A0A8J3CQC0_9PROT|nr:SDR family NAD(P)-dependent oxidoreductase [Algimonas arctica]GHA85241.1 UDP-N-acetylglucosamine 4-epimerase [Algimonas arctica]
MKETILVTGAAGFIGFHASQKLMASGFRVLGVDNLNDYYTPALKQARLNVLKAQPNFEFSELDISDHDALFRATEGTSLTHILHLAAQAGVRYSLENPRAYVDSNIVGHLNILELARHTPGLKHLAYASSSSVYGDRDGGPFHENDSVRKPASLYAATKLGGEMMAESYASLYGIPQTGLRFFTVYGAWGRPDMAYFIFTDRILNDQPITLFAPDKMRRDFTFVGDIVRILPTLMRMPPKTGHAIYNLGNNNPNTLMELVVAVEEACGREAKNKIILPKQAGDVSNTYANVDAAGRDFGFAPSTPLSEGVPKFVDWYRENWTAILAK